MIINCYASTSYVMNLALAKARERVGGRSLPSAEPAVIKGREEFLNQLVEE
jgi:hypothetical protein